MDRHKPLHDRLDPHPRADGMPRPQVTMTLDQDSPLSAGAPAREDVGFEQGGSKSGSMPWRWRPCWPASAGCSRWRKPRPTSAPG